jgi:hypothetical protein
MAAQSDIISSRPRGAPRSATPSPEGDPALGVVKCFYAAQKAHRVASRRADRADPTQSEIASLGVATAELEDAEWALAIIVSTTAAGNLAKLKALAKLDISAMTDLWPTAIKSILRSTHWRTAEI